MLSSWCPNRQLSNDTAAQGDYCPMGLVSKGAFTNHSILSKILRLQNLGSISLKTLSKSVKFPLFYRLCPEGIGRHNIFLYVCPVTFSRPLIRRGGYWGGWARQRKNICYTRKTRQILKGWAELCQTRTLNIFISGVSSWILMLQKGNLVYSLSRLRRQHQYEDSLKNEYEFKMKMT